jgi:hypothetical protein
MNLNPGASPLCISLPQEQLGIGRQAMFLVELVGVVAWLYNDEINRI